MVSSAYAFYGLADALAPRDVLGAGAQVLLLRLEPGRGHVVQDHVGVLQKRFNNRCEPILGTTKQRRASIRSQNIFHIFNILLT